MGRNHSVKREKNTLSRPGRPKVSMNLEITKTTLDDKLVAELELDEEKSFEEIVQQIAMEVRQELAALQDTDSGSDREMEAWETNELPIYWESAETTDGYQSEYSFEDKTYDESYSSANDTLQRPRQFATKFTSTMMKN